MASRTRRVSGDVLDVKWDGKKIDVVYVDADSLEEIWTSIFAEAAGGNLYHVDSHLLTGHMANRYYAAALIDTKGGP